MIKIDINSLIRNDIVERHWKWMKRRFGIDDPHPSESARKRKKQLFGLLGFKDDDDELKNLIKAELSKLEDYANKPEWSGFTRVPTTVECKEFKEIKQEVKKIRKQLKDHPKSRKIQKDLLTKETLISKYQFIIDRELIFSALGYKDFRDDGEKKEIGKEKSENSWGGYDYCLSLNLKVCPYCNREYINTVDRIKLDEDNELKGVRPDFDHFFPESKYPFLSCSIFNLIPACKFCNQLKGDDFSDGKLIYPFEEEFGEQGRFEIDFEIGKNIDTINIENDVNLKLNTSNDLSSPTSARKNAKKQLIDNSNKAFRLMDIYNAHQDQIKEFIKRIRSLRGSGLKTYQAFDQELLNLYNQQSGNTKEYAKKILLGLPTDTQEYPLRKMKNDILKQIGM